MEKVKLSNHELCMQFTVCCYQLGDLVPDGEDEDLYFVSVLADSEFDPMVVKRIPLAETMDEAEALAVQYLQLDELYAKKLDAAKTQVERDAEKRAKVIQFADKAGFAIGRYMNRAVPFVADSDGVDITDELVRFYEFTKEAA